MAHLEDLAKTTLEKIREVYNFLIKKYKG